MSEEQHLSPNLLDKIRLIDLFLATQRKLVGDKIIPLVATNYTGSNAPTIGSTGAVLEVPDGPDHMNCLVLSGLNTGNSIYRIPNEDTISGDVYIHGKITVVNSIETAEATTAIEIARVFGIASLMSLPIAFHGERIGVLTIYSPVEDSFPPEAVQAIKVIASLLGVILGSSPEEPSNDEQSNQEFKSDIQ